VILVAGESLVDLIEADGWGVSARAGGAPFNVARGIARLGTACRFVTGLSNDRFGVMLGEALADDGVDLTGVVRSNRPTALAVAELCDGVANYRFYLDGTAAADVPPSAAEAALDPRVSAVYAGGVALWLEPFGTVVEYLVAQVSPSAVAMIDPNIRPAAIADEALGRARLDRLLMRADIVKASADDLAWMRPGVDAIEAARSLLGARCRCILLTEGPDGARIVTPEAELRVPAVGVAAVDTVGAGDAYCAAFLAWWIDGGLGCDELGDLALLEQAAQHAALVAAMTCERVGATPPRAAEVRLRLAAA
jgi:fructokinase